VSSSKPTNQESMSLFTVDSSVSTELFQHQEVSSW
jgi:hypothetical protein